MALTRGSSSATPSKQSNLAGYRAAFVAGDPALVKSILEVRKHAGFMGPLAGAAGAGRRALRGCARRRHQGPVCRAPGPAETCRRGVGSAGRRLAGRALPVVERGEDSWTTVGRLADLGILVAPGAFYGGPGHSTCGSR